MTEQLKRPIRKPTPKIIKRDKLKIDEDGVSCRWPGAGKELSDVSNETRMRFQDIIANRLNTRRALREIVCPYLIKLQKDMEEMHKKLDHIQQLIKNQTSY